MESGLGMIGRLLPGAIKQPLADLISSTPDSIRQVVDSLPGDLQLVCSTPEGLVLLFATVVAGLFLLLVLAKPAKRKGRSILLVGPCNAGKTTLFYQLKDGELHHGSVASMQENAATCTVASERGTRTASIIDVPGHASMRAKLEALLQEAAGIVFLVDAVDVTPQRTEAADLLYEVLTHPVVVRQRLPLLIACNKADMEMEAHSKDFVRKTLEKQLDSMRKTRTAAIGREAGAGAPALGSADKAFAFADLRSKVALAEVSAKAGNIGDVKSFIVSCV